MNRTDLLDRARLARELATTAGRIALAMQPGIEAREKEDGSGPVTEADLASEKCILDGLLERYPDDPIISEESGTTGTPGDGFVWCVDPLDGTREYSQGRDDFAVMVGLLYNGAPILGAVNIPADNQTVWGGQDIGVYMEDERITLQPLDSVSQATIVHSRSHKSPSLQAVLQKLSARGSVAAGSAGYKAAHLLAGKAHIYIHPSRGTKWWDSVAPAALVIAAGGYFGDATAAAIRYEGDREHMSGLLFAVPGLEDELRVRLS